MTEFLSALKSYIVLSLNDLTQIKDTIARRYAHMTSTERAEILSMAVHNHLDKHLTGIDEAHKEALKIAILKNTLAKHSYSISRLTIFDAILDLPLVDVTKESLAQSWLTETAQITLPRWALDNYMHNRRTSPESLPKLSNDPDKAFVESVIQPTYFDTTQSNKKKTFFESSIKIQRLIPVIALLLFIAIGTPVILLLNNLSNTQDIKLTTLLDANDYRGMSALDRIYLIDTIEGDVSNDQINLTVEKSRYDFGLMKKTVAFRYANFDYFAVKNYISKTRNGLIGSSEQFNQIIHEAVLNDIDPLLLFAIIGQEQAFVPVNASDSLKILNNPYNVYHSWMAYNTTLRDSTQIAINTIKNRLNKAPFSASPFQWLNVTYAEDTNWHNGVRLIYAHLVTIGRGTSIQ